MTTFWDTRRWRIAGFAILAAIAALSSPAVAQLQDDQPAAATAVPEPPEGSVGGMGDINLFPKRIVIDGRRDIATIGLYNKTINEGDYEIQLQDMVMFQDGRLEQFDNGVSEADKARVNTASSFLRYSPRRVTLRGGESQTIRMMARATAEVPPGEYRSHFLALSVPRDVNEGLSIDDALTGETGTGIGVTIRPRFGISIPVIVRIGETTLQVSLSNPQVVTLPDGSKGIGITINRTGTRSAFGDFAVTARGASEPIAISRGIGVYTEIDRRLVVLPINPEADPRFYATGAELSITYTDDDFEPGTKLAETTFVVP